MGVFCSLTHYGGQSIHCCFHCNISGIITSVVMPPIANELVVHGVPLAMITWHSKSMINLSS